MVDVALCCIFFILGALVLCTYAYLVIKFQTYGDQKQKDIWSIYYPNRYRLAWGISSLLSAVFFVAVSVQLIFYSDSASDGWTVAPYTLFLFCSMLYVPLLLSCEDHRWIVICDLILVALSSICLCVRMAILWGFGSDLKIMYFVFLFWIAFHCTVLDGILWGYSWYVQKGFEKTVASELRPSVSLWPRIRRTELAPHRSQCA